MKELSNLVNVPPENLWDGVYTLAPLVLIGTLDADGQPNFAPKHLAMPLGWQPYFGFMCTPKHATFTNILRDRSFTVTFMRPDEPAIASLAAGPRCQRGTKPLLAGLSTLPASRVAPPFALGGYLYLECELHKTVDGFGQNHLVSGLVVAAKAHQSSLVPTGQANQDTLRQQPMLGFIAPNRYAVIDNSKPFPFPDGFKK